jgi:hypothetical protein
MIVSSENDAVSASKREALPDLPAVPDAPGGRNGSAVEGDASMLRAVGAAKRSVLPIVCCCAR